MHRRLQFLIKAAVAAPLLLASIAVRAESGFYSVAEKDGVWWFVSPDGKPFYSLGVCDIGPGPSRSKYEPAQPCYAAFQHYESTEKWAEHTLQRLADWQFNTIGGWADEKLTRGPLPYAIVLHMGAEVGCPWNDLFSDEFVKTMHEFARRRVQPRRDDKNLLGWYSDNEQGWYPDAIFAYHIRESAASKTRSKLIDLLEAGYGNDFVALARDFEVSGAASFEDLSRGGELKLRPGTRGRRIILQFAGALAERYYQVVHDAIRRYDPNHLIMGDRYARNCPDVVAKAAGRYVDVISTNLDWPEAKDGYMPSGYLRNLHRLSGKPVLITEYYVAARENRSGNKNSGNIFLTVDTQEDRTAAVATRLRGLVGQPYVVGAHWFRFADEPTHGRTSDGEDYNFGLVDIHNRPYEGLTSSLVEFHADVPKLHRDSATTKTKPDQFEIPYHDVSARHMLTRLAKARELAIDDDTLQVYQVLSTWTDDKIYLVALVNYLAQTETYSTTTEHPVPRLELAITSPAFDDPLVVPFPSQDGHSQVSGLECHHTTNGMHHSLVVALPARLFSKPKFAANYQFRLGIAVRDPLNQRTTESEVQLRLAGDPKGARPSSGATSAGQ